MGGKEAFYVKKGAFDQGGVIRTGGEGEGKEIVAATFVERGRGKVVCVCVVAAVKTPLASIPAECAALLYSLFERVLIKKGQVVG